MANSLFPGFFRFFYFNDGQEHRHEVPIMPATAGAPITGVSPILTKGGGSVSPESAATGYAIQFAKMLPSTSVVRNWELYGVASIGALPILQATGAVDLPGTAAGSKVEDSQVTITFKTRAGGLIRAIALDSILPYDTVTSSFQVGVTTNFDGFINYMLSDDCIRVGRDNTFPLVYKRLVTKQNDTLRRRRLGI